ncbi:MAG: helix-turn-helix domain-containing protein [Bacteroidales bacterium]|nr:helix-turn-helix domain-containing protein [Bacteroidales bacterium]
MNMYDVLLQLPLFQGLRRDDLTQILDSVRIEFKKANERTIMARQGNDCRQLMYLLNGELVCTQKNEPCRFELNERLTDTQLVEPYSLFGKTPCYRATYEARPGTTLMLIDKSFVLRKLFAYDIIQLNYLNILSCRCQDLQTLIDTQKEEGVELKIRNFIRQRCIQPYGEKWMNMKMNDLAACIGETRLSVSRALNLLESKRLVTLSRGRIDIKNLECL